MRQGCCKHEADRGNQTEKDAGRPVEFDRDKGNAGIESHANYEGEQDRPSLSFADALQQKNDEDQRAAGAEKAEADPFRHAERRRDAAEHGHDLAAAEAQDQAGQHGKDVCRHLRCRMKALRHHLDEDVKAHGERTVEAERRAERDQQHMQPDAEIFRTYEAGSEEIAHADRHQHHEEQHSKHKGRTHAEHTFDRLQDTGC